MAIVGNGYNCRKEGELMGIPTNIKIAFDRGQKYWI